MNKEQLQALAQLLTAASRSDEERVLDTTYTAQVLERLVAAGEQERRLVEVIAETYTKVEAQQLSPVVHRRPEVLECDVVRFQNRKEKWVAFVGLLDGQPYEIFTGLQDDEEGIVLPKTVHNGYIIKSVNSDGTKRYDFQFRNRRGYKTTVEGLSEKFNPEYWNYAKLISGVLRYHMPITNVLRLIYSLELENESINTWKAGVARALKKYLPSGSEEIE